MVEEKQSSVVIVQQEEEKQSSVVIVQQEEEKQSSTVMMQQEIETSFYERNLYPTKKEFQKLYSVGVPRRYKVCDVCHKKHDKFPNDCIPCAGLWECASRNFEKHKLEVTKAVEDLQAKYMKHHEKTQNKTTRDYIAEHRLKPEVGDEKLKNFLSEAKEILGGKELSTPLRFSQVTMEFAKMANIQVNTVCRF